MTSFVYSKYQSIKTVLRETDMERFVTTSCWFESYVDFVMAIPVYDDMENTDTDAVIEKIIEQLGISANIRSDETKAGVLNIDKQKARAIFALEEILPILGESY